MTASRSDQFAKIHKVLKKHYKPSSASAGRTVLEHLLFACCLENAHGVAAEEAFAALVHTFFDWNEIRVTSISELSEVMACLPDPRAAANRIKRVLHAVFESTFMFDLEDRRKKNLGPTVSWLEKLDGTTGFTVAYVVQSALGGHSIPIDAGTMAVLRVLDLVTDKEATGHVVPGLERAVAKSKGSEFGSLLHEFGADYSANPYSPMVREIIGQISPESVDRLPKRRVERPARKPHDSEKQEKPGKRAAFDESKPKAVPEKGAVKKKSAEVAPVVAPQQKKPTSPEPHRKHTASGKSPAASAAPKKHSASERLGKRKPR